MRAQRILLLRRELLQRGGAVVGMRVMTVDASELGGAGTEDHVARFAGVDLAASRSHFAGTAFPGRLVSGEEDLMTARARAVDRRGACRRLLRGRGQTYLERVAYRLERGKKCRILHVLGGAEVTGLAADADLDEMARSEAIAGRRDRVAQGRLRGRRTEASQLLLEQRGHRRPVLDRIGGAERGR